MNKIPSLKNGIAIIKSYTEKLPKSSGVYRMLDDSDNVLYIGKAKNLIKRVSDYTNPSRLSYRIKNMVALTRKMEFITTKTETEALLLEANLIKKFQPRYNILLKDDKSYPYILINNTHKFPRISKHRGQQNIDGYYFGPFSSAGTVNKAIADLQKAFLLRPCTDSFFSNRKKPCIEYQIKRCSAPCTNLISEIEYKKLVKQARECLAGKSRKVQQDLVLKMEEESQKLNYEQAAIYRDRIKALNHIQSRQNINMEKPEDFDVIGIFKVGNNSTVQVFFYRDGQNFGNKAFFLDNVEDHNESEIMVNFILQFYQNNPPPKQIIISKNIEEYDILELALSELADRKIKIIYPHKGIKLKLIVNAENNARTFFETEQNKKISYQNSLKNVQKLFDLDKLPNRIEIYDNSHIFGKYNIGCMVVTDSRGFNKKEYRKYNIKNQNINQSDDYAMMEEVLLRRFKNYRKEKNNSKTPDILIIDGGKGHCTKVYDVLKSIDLTEIKFVCISKGPNRNAGREKFHIYGKESFSLPINDPTLYFLQNLRDEAHRFAISSHRGIRSKSMHKSSLDQIPGIGSKRKKILINHFGSPKEISNATLNDLENVCGINKKIALTIYNFFN